MPNCLELPATEGDPWTVGSAADERAEFAANPGIRAARGSPHEGAPALVLLLPGLEIAMSARGAVLLSLGH